MVSVIQVRRMPCDSSFAIEAVCAGVGRAKTRTERSAAIRVRASRKSTDWKARLNPRTPVSEATPSATASITKVNLAAEARDSRQAMLANVRSWLGNYLHSVSYRQAIIADDQAVFKDDAAIGMAREFGIVRNQHERGAFTTVEVNQQFQNV